MSEMLGRAGPRGEGWKGPQELLTSSLIETAGEVMVNASPKKFRAQCSSTDMYTKVSASSSPSCLE